eukprot:761618-Hanusia_phi.AAC.2
MANGNGSPAVTGRGHIACDDLRNMIQDYDSMEQWVENNQRKSRPKEKAGDREYSTSFPQQS